MDKPLTPWTENLDERQRINVALARDYAEHYSAAGFPGHGPLMLVAKMAELLDAKETPQIASYDLGVMAYAAYGESTHWLTYNGKPMLNWDDLTSAIQQAWIAAAEAVWTSRK